MSLYGWRVSRLLWPCPIIDVALIIARWRLELPVLASVGSGRGGGGVLGTSGLSVSGGAATVDSVDRRQRGRSIGLSAINVRSRREMTPRRCIRFGRSGVWMHRWERVRVWEGRRLSGERVALRRIRWVGRLHIGCHSSGWWLRTILSTGHEGVNGVRTYLRILRRAWRRSRAFRTLTAGSLI